MNNKNKAARNSCNYSTPKDGRLTSSIVSNHEAFALVASSTVFVLVMLAIPTIMAALKSAGVW